MMGSAGDEPSAAAARARTSLAGVGAGCGVLCANLEAVTYDALSHLGSGLAQLYAGAPPLPDGEPGALLYSEVRT